MNMNINYYKEINNKISKITEEEFEELSDKISILSQMNLNIEYYYPLQLSHTIQGETKVVEQYQKGIEYTTKKGKIKQYKIYKIIER